jgi:Condensation domain
MTLFAETRSLHEAARFASIPAAVHDPAAAGQPPAAPRVPTDRVTVAFAGDGAGTGGFTWGQQMIWSAMVRYGWLPIGAVLPQPPGRTVQDMAEEFRYMMSRFPALRTRLRFDAEGRPSQELFADGELTFEVYDADGDADPQETAAAVYKQYATTPHDFVREWPLRLAVVCRDGMPTHVVSLVCHLVADGPGMLILSGEIRTRVTEPPRGMEQLDLARWQDSPAGRRQSAAALSHTETVLRSVPPRPFPRSADRREPRHWAGTLTSAALPPAVRAIADRTRADPSTVLLTLFAIALGRRELQNPAVLRPVVNNRFRPGLRKIVSNIVQTGICVLDVAETTVDEAIRGARGTVRSAYKHAYFDMEAEAALLDRLAREQPDAASWSGEAWTLFNDRRTGKIESLVPALSDASVAQEIRAVRAQTEFRWIGWRDNPFEPLLLNIDDSPRGTVLTALTDTWYVAPADGEGLLRDMEDIAVAAATDPAVPTGVAARDGS